MDILVNEQLIIDIKTRISLVEVASAYTKLEMDGANYKGCCPFPGHDEKTPSFVIFPKGKLDWENFYCFGCHAGNKEETGIGNDIISFVMAVEGLTFIEACQYLCDKYNVPYQQRTYNPEAARLKKVKTDENLNYYRNLINTPIVMNYLAGRGITPESVKKFRLGLTSGNEYSEWKRNRLVFGITDIAYEPIKANTIALGYRNLMGQIETTDGHEYFPNGQPNVKYRNDSESIIFDKGKTLYGLNFANKAIRKRKFAIVVEGYVDVILMHQAGLDNTVAPLGTSFTEDQMDLLRRYTDQILFFLDSDNAGLESMRRTLPKLLEKGFSVLVVEAPTGQDPADLVNSLNQNCTAISEYIRSNSTPALQWSIDKSLKIYDAAVHKAKVEALGVALPLLDKITHRESKIAYITSIGHRLGIDASAFLLTEPKKEMPAKTDEMGFKQQEVKPVSKLSKLQNSWTPAPMPVPVAN